MATVCRTRSIIALTVCLAAAFIGTAVAGPLEKRYDPHAERINLVYANSGRAPDLMLRSAWSAISTASNATLSRLNFHFLYTGTPGAPECFQKLEQYGPKVYLYEDPIKKMPFKPKVWGYGMHFASFREKLESPANYWRFYLHRIMSEEMVLYIDGDTLFFGDIGMVWDTIHKDLKASDYAVAAGVQENKGCNFGKMLLLKDPRIAHLRMKSKEKCLTGGVLFINLPRWKGLGLTALAEEIMQTNGVKKLYHLGSMPPLMILTHKNYLQLPDEVVHDSKGQKCCSGAHIGKFVIWHPTKKVETVQAWQKDLLMPPWIEEGTNGAHLYGGYDD